MNSKQQITFNSRNKKLNRWAVSDIEFKGLDVRRQRRYVSIIAENCTLLGRAEWRKQARRKIGASI